MPKGINDGALFLKNLQNKWFFFNLGNMRKFIYRKHLVFTVKEKHLEYYAIIIKESDSYEDAIFMWCFWCTLDKYDCSNWHKLASLYQGVPSYILKM